MGLLGARAGSGSLQGSFPGHRHRRKARADHDRSLATATAGKRVLITGASAGIGRATALRMGEAGAIVLLVARSPEKLAVVKEEIENAGGTAFIHTADLSDLESCDALVAEVLAQHGSVDILVNNAGRSIRRSVNLS
ncbi:MAG: SDR family NAD(P)-dependent oxidoreductase, partial [Deltaproteobacteria bacterium]|nr:SDR family NAD(P)-dependent oxidoreductase [Deltaproteobacteria bacterium]